MVRYRSWLRRILNPIGTDELDLPQLAEDALFEMLEIFLCGDIKTYASTLVAVRFQTRPIYASG